MEKLISVILPTFQRCDIVERALESIFAQRAIGEWVIEAIVIDDGSSDGTDSVIAGFRPPVPHRLVYKRIHHVGKPGLVRNVGLKLCSGELIAYCDSDDIWLPHHLRTCLRQFEIHPDIVMVETWWSFQKLTKGLRRWQISYTGWATDGRTTTTNSRIHRRSVLAKVGFFNDDEYGEDIEFWTRISFCGPVRRVKMPTTAHSYTYGGNNITFRHNATVNDIFNSNQNGPERLVAALKAELDAAHRSNAVLQANLATLQQASTPELLTPGRKLRRRLAYAIERPRSAALLAARKFVPLQLKRNNFLRCLARVLLRIPVPNLD